MSNNPYEVVASPSYAGPTLDWNKFFPHKQQPQQGQQQSQPASNGGFLGKLAEFLHGPSSPVPAQPYGAPTPGAQGATSVGGAPLVQSGSAAPVNTGVPYLGGPFSAPPSGGFMNNNGQGFY